MGAAVVQGFGQSTNAPAAYPALYVFGSSWADTRNNTSALFYRGHWSNGPMWPEFLSTNLGLAYLPGNNFAVGGSYVADVQNQVIAFHAPTNVASCLVHFWAGYTDFYNIDGLANDPLWNSRIRSWVNTLSNSLVRLYVKGARSILVPNVFDRSHDPAFVALWQNDPVSRGQYSARIDSFNTAWASALAAIDGNFPDLRLFTFDFHAQHNNLVTNFAAAGFVKAAPDALDDPALTNKTFTGPGENYLYWDGHHSTSKAHAIFAGWYYDALSTGRLEQIHLQVAAAQVSLQLTKLQVGRAYTLQQSSDLAAWQDIQSFTATAGTNSWTAPLPQESAAYFRLKWHP
jgi:phospholipase/lecithinase/hemolysin